MLIKSKRHNKYGNRRAGGYDSRREATRAAILRSWQRQGLISDLREQVPYVLIPAQYGTCGQDFKGKTVRVCLEKSCKYIADFVYTDAVGNTVVEDTKGVRTKDYVIKRKLMLYLHGIRVREV